jgi:hypothetical protein
MVLIFPLLSGSFTALLWFVFSQPSIQESTVFTWLIGAVAVYGSLVTLYMIVDICADRWRYR